MNFAQEIYFAFWFFLPAGLANMFPIFAAHLPMIKNWNYPMDFYRSFHGKRILGPNKTIRGFVSGTLVAIIVVLIQKQLTVDYGWHGSFDYTQTNPWVLGLLLGSGALLGDALKSFVKRQSDIDSGESFLFFDQIDYIFGGILMSFWYAPLQLEQYVYIVLLYFILHLLSTSLGYLLGLKKSAI